MTAKLELENQQLRQRLRSFTVEASNNEALMNKFHERELALLSCDGLAELLVSMTEGLRLSFLLDDITSFYMTRMPKYANCSSIPTRLKRASPTSIL